MAINQTTRLCEKCGAVFQTRKRGKGRERFCSLVCANSRQHADALPNEPRSCERCSTTFTPPRTRRSQRFCSRQCWRRPVLSETDRFWSRVNKCGPVPFARPELGPCWLWIGFRQSEGYGRFGPEKTRSILAHRWAYERIIGPIPQGCEIDHLCRNPPCVNPQHMEPVTERVNTLRGEGPTARNARKTHCIRGHAFTPENTILRPSGGRTCRICRRANSARSEARRPKRQYAPRHPKESQLFASQQLKPEPA